MNDVVVPTHPRDRRDPMLAQFKALSLTELQRAHVI
jgi:sulfonate transport system ATP-binding protein